MSGGRWVVRVRAPRFAWTTDGMDHPDALALQETVLRSVRDIGDGPGLFEFRAREDRFVSVRARDVLSVEVEPWLARRDPEREARPPAEPAPDGTTFLRQHAGCEA